MLSIKSYIKMAQFEESMGLNKPHVFGASTRTNSIPSIVPSNISNEMKDICNSCKKKLGLNSDVLEKKSKETFKLVEETIPGTSEKTFTIK